MKKREFVPRENLLKINGENKSREAIGQEYVNLIEDDYNATVDEICDYLRVSKPYFNKYKTAIRHINISTTVRTRCIPEVVRGDEFPLITKRILYSRSDFERFLFENFKVETFSIRIPLDIISKHKKKFDIDIFNKVLNSSEGLKLIDAKNMRMIQSQMNEAVELVDYKDIMKLKNYKHTTDAYKFIKDAKLSRYILNNSIRYSIDEVQSQDIILPYDFLPQLSNNELFYLSKEEIFKSFLENEYKKFPHYAGIIDAAVKAKIAISKWNSIMGN